MNLEQTQARLDELVTLMRALTTPPASADDDWGMTRADAARFDEAESEAAKLRAELDVDRRKTMISRSNSVMRGDDSGAGFNVNRLGDPFGSEVRLDETEASLRSRIAAGLEADPVTPAEVAEGISRTLVTVDGDRRALAIRCLATASDHYRAAFAKLMNGSQATWSDDERQSVARAQSLVNAEGGFAVPFTLDPSIIQTDAGSINPLRRIARRVTTTTDSWNGVSAGAVSFSWDAEAEEVSDDSITLAQPSIPVHKMQGFVPFSVEVGGDWASIEADLRAAMMEGRDNLEATTHLTGTGTGEGTGIVTALAGGASEVAADTAETFSAEDLYALQRALPARHRLAGPVWTLNIGTIGDIRQFDTSGGGNFLTSLGNGTPESLLGWQMAEHSLLDDSPDIDPAVTDTNYVAIVGNWSRFIIVDRTGMNVELVPHLFGVNRRPTGQRGLYAWLRSGSAVVDDNAFRMLNVATTL